MEINSREDFIHDKCPFHSMFAWLLTGQACSLLQCNCSLLFLNFNNKNHTFSPMMLHVCVKRLMFSFCFAGVQILQGLRSSLPKMPGSFSSKGPSSVGSQSARPPSQAPLAIPTRPISHGPPSPPPPVTRPGLNAPLIMKNLSLQEQVSEPLVDGLVKGHFEVCFKIEIH